MRINKDGQNTDVPVYKAIALHGVTGRRLVTLKTSLATTGKAHTETRVKHGNRAHQMKGEILSKICQHIQSLRDTQLELFLHSCKCSLEFTKTTIEAYYTVRTSTPEFFSDRDLHIPELQQIKSVT
ncbi:hypothetical protein ANN_03262 [Periplaneta americana]|uniref:Uncharacterized protein n=1 Tax=Periplaneta americana TaxID=6978 RepID=A0ABQ8U2K2_PERAM|nr:hypothetical protein ANN_03262 [Periplaneta americana]